MKKLFILFLLSLPCFYLTVFGQSLNYSKITPHPRLLLKEGAEKTIKNNLKSNPELLRVHDEIIAYSNLVLDAAPSERIMEGKRLLGVSRTVLKRIFYLSYAYRITGDTRYSLRAEKEMLAASAFSDWNPSHFLDVGEMVMALGIGYDWLYNTLQSSTKKIVREAIVQKGFIPSKDKKFAWFLEADHNWNQVCNGGLLFGALAIYEDEKEFSTEIIERSLETITKPLLTYGPDGNYAEGYGYWGYGTSFQVLYLAALESAFGTDNNLSQIPGFLESARFMEFMTGPTKLPFNFSDAERESLANVIMYWFAKKTNDMSLLWVEKDYLKEEKLNFAEDRLLPALLVFASDIKLNKIPKPSMNYWAGHGKNPVIFVRTDWEDKNALYLGFKGGSASVSHAHMDAGSFVFDAEGVRWAMDLGMQQYYSLEKEGVDLWNMGQHSQRWEVFRYNNFVHNTLTVNNKLHNVKGEAVITKTNNTKNKMGGVMDLTEIFKGELKEATREVNIIDKKYLLVTDNIEAGDKEVRIRWTMATPADAKVINDNTFELQQDGKRLRLIVESPFNFKLKTWSTQSKNAYDAPNDGTKLIGFETQLNANQKGSIHVKLIPQK